VTPYPPGGAGCGCPCGLATLGIWTAPNVEAEAADGGCGPAAGHFHLWEYWPECGVLYHSGTALTDSAV